MRRIGEENAKNCHKEAHNMKFGQQMNKTIGEIALFVGECAYEDLVALEWIVSVKDAESSTGYIIEDRDEAQWLKTIEYLESFYQEYGAGGHAGLLDRGDFAYRLYEYCEENGVNYKDVDHQMFFSDINC